MVFCVLIQQNLKLLQNKIRCIYVYIVKLKDMRIQVTLSCHLNGLGTTYTPSGKYINIIRTPQITEVTHFVDESWDGDDILLFFPIKISV